jgi:hypothetical protein
MGWINVAQDRRKGRAVLSMEMNLPVSYKAWNLLNS